MDLWSNQEIPEPSLVCDEVAAPTFKKKIVLKSRSLRRNKRVSNRSHRIQTKHVRKREESIENYNSVAINDDSKLWEQAIKQLKKSPRRHALKNGGGY